MLCSMSSLPTPNNHQRTSNHPTMTTQLSQILSTYSGSISSYIKIIRISFLMIVVSIRTRMLTYIQHKTNEFHFPFSLAFFLFEYLFPCSISTVVMTRMWDVRYLFFLQIVIIWKIFWSLISLSDPIDIPCSFSHEIWCCLNSRLIFLYTKSICKYR